ncbi:hypothetical protein GCM10014713_44450 [Streptomyces purpureus]|uniref:Uncharacterized protein n=1 Tax=Streptomyces purpureus TaxID=1951 RepID=A0A918H980_9ACTN|nr:hypothetical protein GCM10014713_44450 [Streptomyces purpureus]
MNERERDAGVAGKEPRRGHPGGRADQAVHRGWRHGVTGARPGIQTGRREGTGENGPGRTQILTEGQGVAQGDGPCFLKENPTVTYESMALAGIKCGFR